MTEIASRFIFTHQIEQVFVVGDEILRVGDKSKVDINLVIWIAWVAECFGDVMDENGVHLQTPKEITHALLGQILKFLSQFGP